MGVGIDWANGGWLAVSIGDGIEATTYPEFEAVWDEYVDEAILVDIPIGLVSRETIEDTGNNGRECDSLARSAITPRYRSVFTPPCREALNEIQSDKEPAYDSVSSTNKDVTDKGLTKQAFHISKAIGQVDSFLDSNEDAVGRVRESHPEVCFRALAGEPLSASKTSAQGFGQRLAALDAVADAPERDIRTIAQALDDEDIDADIDDVLDALVLAHVADAPENEIETLPENPPSDDADLPMEIVYRANEPFDIE